jgi:hypothetical protein
MEQSKEILNTNFEDSGLFGDDDDKPNKKALQDFEYNKDNFDLFHGGSDGEDSDVDRPPLNEADLRRREHRRKCK